MSFDLKQIPGAMLKKHDLPGPGYGEYDERALIENYNHGAEDQSSVRLKQNREKLAETIWNIFWPQETWDYHKVNGRGMSTYMIADAIIANELEIIEVEK